MRVSLDARIDLPTSGSFAAIIPITLGVSPASAGVNYQAVVLAHSMGRIEFEVFREFADGGSSVSAERVTASNGAYHHIALSLRSASGTTKAALEIDGAGASTLSFQTQTPTSIALNVGAPFTNEANVSATVRIDNVIVERL